MAWFHLGLPIGTSSAQGKKDEIHSAHFGSEGSTVISGPSLNGNELVQYGSMILLYIQYRFIYI